jgi:hypothetical protein
VNKRTEESLEAAGWERWEPQEQHVVFWRNPKDGLWHAQNEAIELLEGRPASPGGGDDAKWQGEARELKEAGWEPRGRGPKTLWRDPSSGKWYAHRQAMIGLHRDASP